MDVVESIIWNWESGHSQPDFRDLPAIIVFLGYNPLPEAETLAEKLVRHRTTLGMSRKGAAADMGVDQGRWRGGSVGSGSLPVRCARRFLAEATLRNPREHHPANVSAVSA